MTEPVLRYLLVFDHDRHGAVVDQNVERYTAGQYEAAFKPDEQLAIDAGRRVYRPNKIMPGGSTYMDMVVATRRWHGEPSEAMVQAGVRKAMSTKLGGEYRWPDYLYDLWIAMRDAAL